MRDWLESGWEFIRSTVRHGWAFFVLVVLDLGDVYSRFVDPLLPGSLQGMSLSPFIFWPIVGAGILWATISTYHDARQRWKLNQGQSVQRPEFIELDTDRVGCEWFGNECRLEQPVLFCAGQFQRGTWKQLVPNVVPRGSLGRFRCEPDGPTTQAGMIVRAIGSHEQPQHPNETTEAMINKKHEVELVVVGYGEFHGKVWLEGWKERE